MLSAVCDKHWDDSLQSADVNVPPICYNARGLAVSSKKDNKMAYLN